MVYEYEDKLLDYASGSKTYEEYKAMSQELQEVYRKAKAFDEFKNYYHTEIAQAINNLKKFNTNNITGATIFLLEKILSDLEDE